MFAKETKYIIGKERARKFAKLMCEPEDLERVLGKVEGEGYHWPSEKMLERLIVPGFTEVVEVFEFVHNDNSEERSHGRPDKDYWSTDTSIFMLQIIPTGEVLRVWAPENSWKRCGFSLLERYHGATRDFTFSEERPQYVGTATQKKIEAWRDYLHRERQAEINYVAQARAKNAQLRAAILKRFPDAKLSEGPNGWLVEARYQEGVLDYHVTACENGGFTRSYSANYLRVPSAKDQLGIE